MKAKDKLSARYSKKECDIVITWPAGTATKADAHWLCDILSRKFQDELERRGYDPSTIKFSVEPKKGNSRFASQQVVIVMPQPSV